MKYFVIILFFIVSGCASVSVETDNCKISYVSFFKDFKALKGDICGGKISVAEATPDLTNLPDLTELLKLIK